MAVLVNVSVVVSDREPKHDHTDTGILAKSALPAKGQAGFVEHCWESFKSALFKVQKCPFLRSSALTCCCPTSLS